MKVARWIASLTTLSGSGAAAWLITGIDPYSAPLFGIAMVVLFVGFVAHSYILPH